MIIVILIISKCQWTLVKIVPVVITWGGGGAVSEESFGEFCSVASVLLVELEREAYQ